MSQPLIRNFCVISHVDHGKSTLADRFLEITATIEKRKFPPQLLDSHPISRKRGITIRLAPVTMKYSLLSSLFTLNLIDTPGHVDFSYETERSLAACEGAILLVDATTGAQAQTLAHFQKAVNLGLTIIPAINKIDSPNARIAQTEEEIKNLFDPSKIFLVSAKTGQGVKDLLDAVIEKIPPPSGNPSAPTRALIFSSSFDPSRGVTAFVRLVDGKINSHDKITFLATTTPSTALEIGHFSPNMKPCPTLSPGEIGYVVTSLKDPSLVRIGDTITVVSAMNQQLDSTVNPLPGYRDAKPMVFTSFFPVDQNDFSLLKDDLQKLKLNDAAITFSPTSSQVLGRGYRCGFLGHLHAEISQERLATDFGLSIIATTPTVEYKINVSHNLLEPIVKATILTPSHYVGTIIALCQDRRGKMTNLTYAGQNATLVYELPLAEIATDFFGELKSQSSGFASLDYEVIDYRPFAGVQLDILINHEPIDAFSQILEKSRAEKLARFLVDRLKELIPRQQIPIAIQAAINGQIIARADIPSFRKDVTAKLYGGDFTRKLKLLEKQKKGKEKMKVIGKVQIPPDTFLKVFKS